MKSWIFIGLLLSLMSGAAYFYYSTTQTRIETLISDNSTLTSNVSELQKANQENINTIDNLNINFERVQTDYSELQSEFQEIRKQNAELRERLGEHDLEYLARNKPGLVENIINGASDDALRCFEILSGSPLTEDEKNAKSEKEFNSECPFLWSR